MSKTAQAAKEATPVVEGVQITLSEFCIRLSEKVRRPELIAGFESTERRSGRAKDTVEAFQARFDEFLKTPV